MSNSANRAAEPSPPKAGKRIGVRRAKPEDIPAIYACQRAAYSEYPPSGLCDERHFAMQLEAFPDDLLSFAHGANPSTSPTAAESRKHAQHARKDKRKQREYKQLEKFRARSEFVFTDVEGRIAEPTGAPRPTGLKRDEDARSNNSV